MYYWYNHSPPKLTILPILIQVPLHTSSALDLYLLPLYGYAPQTRQDNHLTTQLPHFLQSHLLLSSHTNLPLTTTHCHSTTVDHNSHFLYARLLNSHGTISISYSTCIIYVLVFVYGTPVPPYTRIYSVRALGTHLLRLTQDPLTIPSPTSCPHHPATRTLACERSNAVDIDIED